MLSYYRCIIDDSSRQIMLVILDNNIYKENERKIQSFWIPYYQINIYEKNEFISCAVPHMTPPSIVILKYHILPRIKGLYKTINIRNRLFKELLVQMIILTSKSIYVLIPVFIFMFILIFASI